MHRYIPWIATLIPMLACVAALHGQSAKRPIRAIPPLFDATNAAEIFYADLETVLVGELPLTPSASIVPYTNHLKSPRSGSDLDTSSRVGTLVKPMEGFSASENDHQEWSMLISAASLEDLIKESKQRLDRAISTPTAFAGGGYHEVRTEYSLLSLLFAIIEIYSDNVRWKSSAASLKAVLNRTASNAKVGSRQVYEEAKRRKGELEDVLNGTVLNVEPNTEVAWENLIDIAPLMQLLGSAFEKHVTRYVASETEFKKNSDELKRYSELIAILATAATFENMPHADDDQFRAHAMELVQSARQVVDAVVQRDPDAARIAGGNIGQACQKCHESYR